MAKKTSQTKPENKVNITNVLPNNTIQLYGYVGKWQDVDWTPFQRAFREIDLPGNDITILVNCYGGDVFTGLAIYDLIKSAKGNVTIINEGMAASMGGVLLQAAKKGFRKGMPNSRVMVHRVTGRASGDADDLREYADQLVSEEDNIKNLFVTTTGQSIETVKSWMKRSVDKWFTAKEALEAGLIDEIIEPQASSNSSNSFDFNNCSEADIQQFFNSTEFTNNFNMNKYQMAILAILASAGITETPPSNATDEQWVELLNKGVNAFKTKATDAENKLKLVNTSRAQEFVNSLKQSGKLSNEITPDQEAMIVDQATNHFDVVKTMFGAVNVAQVENTASATSQGTPTTDINQFLNNGGKKTIENKSGIPQDRANWDITKWAKEDPAGLQNLAKTQPKEYQNLLNAVENKLVTEGVKVVE